eukprot:SAG22_NODE_1045_length_5866_cov_1.781516_6_plen_42_part_00
MTKAGASEVVECGQDLTNQARMITKMGEIVLGGQLVRAGAC